ncbi:MAG: endonuclease/exonuclease/phosphatase family protein [Bacteroidota bacterium]
MRKLKFYSVLLGLSLIFNCGGESEPEVAPVIASFREAKVIVAETQVAESILLEFESPTASAGSIELLVTEYNAQYQEDYTTQPPAVNNSIILQYSAGVQQINVVIAPQTDNDNIVDSLALHISENDLVSTGSNPSTTVIISEAVSGSCNSFYGTASVLCTPTLLSQNLDIVTWNIENFPMRSNSVSEVIDIIRDLNADIYAIQEIDEISNFQDVVDGLPGYEGIVTDVRGGIELAYLYKTSEISSISTPIRLFEDQRSPFPRQPVETNITHINGLQIKLINLHLKCCDDGIERRADASRILKSYLDDNYADQEVVVLGDWNEDLVNGSNSFANFINDTENYLFVDLPINQGSSTDFSYQLFNPVSHLDHLLLSNELCDNVVSTATIKLDQCVSNYFSNVSDHRPVMVSLKED